MILRTERLLVGALMVVAACYADAGIGPGATGANGTTGSNGVPGGPSDLPCDVDAVLAKNCRACHGAAPLFGAPMSLTTHAALTAPAVSDRAKKVYELVGARVHDDTKPMPPPPNARLDASAIGVLEAWIAAGAPSSTESCDAPPTGSLGTTSLGCTPDQKVRPASKFTVPQDAADLYVCYGFDVANDGKRHVIAGAPFIDNTKVVHHIILFQSDDAMPAMPAPCSGAGGNGRFVAGWAPGGTGFEIPKEAGFPQEAGMTHYFLQVHYNNAPALVGEMDGSGFDLCTTDQLRPNDADVMASGSLRINIPPRSTHEVSCDYAWPADAPKVHVFSAAPHMHRLGRKENAVLLPVGTEEQRTILDAPAFDFSNGGGGKPASVDIAPGDVIRTTCNWQNPSDATVTFGEATGDEMCFNFMMYYPKVMKSGFNWRTPAIQPSFVPGKCVTK